MIGCVRSAMRIAVLMASALAVLSIASLVALAAVPSAAAGTEPTVDRQAQLDHLLTQDCGSCHGLTLAGGLGPSLQTDALENKPVAYLTAIILYGRPGTAMPPWRPFLSDAEATWLAQRLKRGTL